LTTYYAVCNVNGPISRAIEAESLDEAVDQFRAADTRAWIDEPALDAEDDLDIVGEDMDENEFCEAMIAAGYAIARDLDGIVAGQGPTMRNAHVSNGWVLFAEA
jgi:hypothetical protein